MRFSAARGRMAGPAGSGRTEREPGAERPSELSVSAATHTPAGVRGRPRPGETRRAFLSYHRKMGRNLDSGGAMTARQGSRRLGAVRRDVLRVAGNVDVSSRARSRGPPRPRLPARRGPPPDRGRSRRRQDHAGQGAGAVDRLLVPAHPVHARPAAHRRHRRQRVQPGARATSSSSPGPIFANIVLGRRDQPGLPQDPVGAARGHGGAPGHGGRR